MKRFYDISMLVLILYVLIQLSLDIIIPFSESTSLIIRRIDFIICVLFLSDWVYFLVKAENKWFYFKTHLFDLISSIPFSQMLRPFRIFRFVRLIRSFRLIRGLRAASPLTKFLFKSKSRSMLSIYLILTLAIYFYCCLGLYNFEFGLNKSISNFSDVMWMSFTTLTSVGYGDIYPVTGGGRIMAAILVITGMGLFSLLTAEFASVIISFTKKETEEVKHTSVGLWTE